MSSYAQVAPSAITQVFFRSDTLFLVEHDDQPYVPMKPIV